MKRKNLIINTLLLTTSTMVLGFLGMFFRIYLSNKIGSEGMGLFQLIMSINIFASTVSVSGIRLTLTRLVAEEVGKNNKDKVKSLLKYGICYTLFFSIVASYLLYSQANFISEVLIGDLRSKVPLQILSLSLPFVGITSCFNGYFYGLRKVVKSIFSDLIESVTMILIVAFFVTSYSSSNLEYTCSYITVGMSIGSIISCFCSYIMYLFESKNFKNIPSNKNNKNIFVKILRVALPVAGSAYVKTFLKSIEDILIPKNLKIYGSSSYASLSIFGVIKGMALPLINFPTIFLASFSTLIIPEIAQYNVLNKPKSVNFVISKVIKFTLLVAIFSTGIFMYFSYNLGQALYHNNDVGLMLRILAPLIPFMYLDRIVDGSLNALDQQVYTLRYNLLDMTIRIILINILIPRLGIDGFVLVLYISTIFNFSLSFNRLLKVTNLNFKFFDWIIKPTFAILVSLLLTQNIHTLYNINSLPLLILIPLFIYICFLFIFRSLKKRDIMWFVDAFKNDPKKADWKEISLYKQI